MLLFLRNILQLILSPSRGWEDISSEASRPEIVLRRCLYPLLGVTALSAIAQYIYDSEMTFAVMVVIVFGTFVSYFAGTHFSLMVFRSYLYKFTYNEPSDKKITNVVMYVVALLAIARIFCNLMPVDLGFSFLLPLAVTLVMWKAMVYLCVKEDREMQYVVFGFLTLIIPPLALMAIFSF